MNKTLSIGLAGFSFVIEEHAYIKLSDYLAALRNSLDAAEADEVMHDIEIRMVEIFRDSLGKREVINDGDVEQMIAQIGRPEQIEEQEEAYYSEKTAGSRTAGGAFTGQRQLFRDPSIQKIAGVCAGLAHYTGMDVSLMRILWLGIGILGIFTAAISTTLIVIAYIILWAVLPTAQTASDFLKMKGKPVNFDTLKDESNKIIQFANESSQRVGEIYTDNKPYIQNAGNGIWNAIRYILGGIFALMSVFSILGVFAIFGLFSFTETSALNEFDFLFDGEMSWVLKALMTVGALIPAVLFGLLAIKLLSPKTQIRNLGYVLGALFIAALGLGLYFGISVAKQDMLYKGQNQDEQNMAINTTSDSIYIDIQNVKIPAAFTAYDNDLFSDKKSVFLGDEPVVEVTRKTDAVTPYLTIKKSADGYNVPMDLKVPVQFSGNTILLPNFIQYPYADRFRDYEVNYELVVPAKTRIFSKNTGKIHLEGDVDGDGNRDNDWSNTGNVSVQAGGNSIVINPDNKDSIIINGKKYPKAVAEKTLDSMNINKDNLEKVNISIQSGEKEISIKTK